MAILGQQAQAVETQLTPNSMLKCMACKEAVKHVDEVLLGDTVVNAFSTFVEDTCNIVTKLVLPGFTHCDDYIQREREAFLFSFVDGLLGQQRVCEEWTHFCDKPAITELDLKTVVSDILKDKPASIQDDSYQNNMYAEIKKNASERQTLKAVHLSDVHLDPDYTVGAKANCADST